ncbi:MAG: hypothetical protein F6K10_36685 [Moorea sp. SIO2B7]|nr:hypothetical protein [Moorena sp. SIO2B7]
MNNTTAQTKITLQDATLKSAALADPLTLNGQIELENQLITVNQLEGTFAQSKLSVRGNLPLIKDNRDLSNPLTVAIEQGEIDFQGLYKGKINGQVIVTGAALNPIIGGEIHLFEGQAFLPQKNSDTESNIPDFGKWTATVTGAIATPDGSIVPKLNNFSVVIGPEFKFKQSPFYKFILAGDLTLNGAINDFKNLQPEGIIRVERGDVTLVNTNFFLVRTHNNIIEFKSEQGLLNPNLDIVMETVVPEISGQISNSTPFLRNNEIRDDLFRTGRANTIKVTMRIDGKASELLPSLGKSASDVCQIGSDYTRIFVENYNLSEEDLENLETCINLIVFEGGEDRQILNSRIVQLTSRPSRSEGQIIALLTSQFLVLAEQLQNSNSEEILQFGVTEFVIDPLLQDVLFEAQQWVTSAGSKIGLADLRVYPLVEGIYKVGDQSFIGVTYDYFFDEVQVRYEMRF